MLPSLLLAAVLVQASPVPDPLETSPEMRAFLDRKVARGLPELQRLEALDAVLFQDPEAHFTYSQETRSAGETFATRNGNCLSFTVMFIAMARYLGLDAAFREVQIAPVFSMNGTYSTLNLHVNAAVLIGGRAYVVDVYPGVNRIEIGGRLVPDERGFAHYFNNCGVRELGHGDVPAAERFFYKALEFDPTAAHVWVNLGVAKVHVEQYGEAEKFYRKAIEIDPGDPAALNDLAVVCERTGRFQEAARYISKAKSLWEKNPYHHYNLGTKAYDSGEYEQSLVHFRKAIKLKRTDHHFYFAMAKSYVQLKRPGDATNNLKLAAKYAADDAGKQRYNQKLEFLKSSPR